MRISDWSSDVCSSDLRPQPVHQRVCLPVEQTDTGAGRDRVLIGQGIDRFPRGNAEFAIRFRFAHILRPPSISFPSSLRALSLLPFPPPQIVFSHFCTPFTHPLLFCLLLLYILFSFFFFFFFFFF